MKTAKLTAILLAAAIILLLAVPPLRRTLDLLRYNPIGDAYGTWLRKAQVERVVKQHPEDAEMWLAFAECGASSCSATSYRPNRYWNPTYPWDQSWSPKEAYQRAISLAPDSPAPYLRHAIYLLANSGWLGREEWSADRKEEPRRTAEQTANLREAKGLLKKARQLQPDNAACDYLLAYIHLAQHKDEQAFTALRQAINKPHWNIGSQVAAPAVLRLLDATGSASPLLETHALSIAMSNGNPTTTRLRSLSRNLDGLGEQFRNSAQHQKAILCCEAAVQLGYVMRKDAYSVIDGLVAIAITKIAAASFLSEEKRQRIIRETPNQDERMGHVEEARVANFAAYMRTHGRADLGKFYREEVQAANQWKNQARAALHSGVPLTVFIYGWPRYSRLMWLQAGILLVLWLLVGLTSVVVRYWREPRAGLAWAWWQWLLLMAILVGGVPVVAITFWDRLFVYSFSYPYPTYVSAAILGLSWLVVVLVVTIVEHARQAPTQRLGKARTCLATLRVLVPVTFAVLFLLSVISLWPARQSIKPWRDQTRAEILQGEVQYWGLSSPSAQQASSQPAGQSQSTSSGTGLR